LRIFVEFCQRRREFRCWTVPLLLTSRHFPESVTRRHRLKLRTMQVSRNGCERTTFRIWSFARGVGKVAPLTVRAGLTARATISCDRRSEVSHTLRLAPVWPADAATTADAPLKWICKSPGVVAMEPVPHCFSAPEITGQRNCGTAAKVRD